MTPSVQVSGPSSGRLKSDTPGRQLSHRRNTRHTGNNNDAGRVLPCTEYLRRSTS